MPVIEVKPSGIRRSLPQHRRPHRLSRTRGPLSLSLFLRPGACSLTLGPMCPVFPNRLVKTDPAGLQRRGEDHAGHVHHGHLAG